MNLPALIAELVDDPLTRGYAAMSPEAVIASLRTADRQGNYVLSSNELLAWAGDAGRAAKLRKAADGVAPYDALPDSVRSVAIVADVMVRRETTAFDRLAPGRMEMLDALVAGGVFTADDKASLLAMTVTAISRAEELGIPDVEARDVRDARSVINGE